MPTGLVESASGDVPPRLPNVILAWIVCRDARVYLLTYSLPYPFFATKHTVKTPAGGLVRFVKDSVSTGSYQLLLLTNYRSTKANHWTHPLMNTKAL